MTKTAELTLLALVPRAEHRRTARGCWIRPGLYTYLEPVRARAEFVRQAEREAAELTRDPRQCGEWVCDAYGRNARYCSPEGHP